MLLLALKNKDILTNQTTHTTHNTNQPNTVYFEVIQLISNHFTMYNYYDESTRHSLLSQMLNDQGAQLIDDGEYRRAIDVLIKALKLYEGVANVRDACACHHCRLETCITRSKRLSVAAAVTASTIATTTGTPKYDVMSKGCPRHHHPRCYHDGNDDDDDDDDMMDVDDDIHNATTNNSATTAKKVGYIYRHPIYCAPTFSHEDHYPGITLLVIIIFNLALSYHLVSINEPSSSSVSSSSTTASAAAVCQRKLTKALQLYEFFYQLQMERNIFSTQAMLAVANNVGEIHRVVGNQSKYTMCLEHLTSCLMLVVEDQNSQRSESSSASESTSASSPPIRPQVQNTITPTTTSVTATNGNSNSSSNSIVRLSRQNSNQHLRMQPNSEEMKGYWKNASKAILHNNCAGAA
jgi:hypothetical protein